MSESAYYTPHQPSSGIQPTINVPPPAQHQWTGQATFQHQVKRPRKRVRNVYQFEYRQSVQFINSSNRAYQHPAPPYQAQQPMCRRGVCRGRRQGRRRGTENMQGTHTNKIKQFHNLHYSFTCGYDVDHPSNACPVSDPAYHMPNIPHDEVWKLCFRYASVMLTNKGGTNSIFEKRDMCICLGARKHTPSSQMWEL